METTTTSVIPPQISMAFSADLLSAPMFRYDSLHLFNIGTFLLLKIVKQKFRKFPRKVNKLIEKHDEFMELYGRAKDKEREVEGQPFNKARAPFYRPRLSNQDDQRAFEKLDDRRQTSQQDRRNHAISKVSIN